MATLVDNLLSVLGLLGTASFMIVVTLIVLSLKFFKPQAAKSKRGRLAAKAFFGVAMGILAIFGTLWGMKLADGTIINVRELAAMIAGAAGGPVGGIIAGLIGGIHRFSAGGATALPCAISTVTIGIFTGVFANKISGKWYLVKAAAVGFLLETLAMGLIIMLVPTGAAIVDKIYFSMIGANTIGFVLWVYLANKFKQSQTQN
jgi:LytS/YehU family sensor histidine kinase